jgi:hypothetical protein
MTLPRLFVAVGGPFRVSTSADNPASFIDLVGGGLELVNRRNQR